MLNYQHPPILMPRNTPSDVVLHIQHIYYTYLKQQIGGALLNAQLLITEFTRLTVV